MLGALALTAMVLGAAGGTEMAAVLGSLSLEGLVFGGALLAAGGVRASGAQPPTFGLRGPAPFLVAIPVLMVAGQAVLHFAGPAVGLAFPFVHVSTLLTVALAIVAAVAWRSGGAARVDVWSGLAYGGCIATLGALVVEAVLVGGAVVFVATFADLHGLLDAFTKAMQAAGPGGMPELSPDAITAALLQPAVILALVGVMGLAGPATEELFKLSGVAVHRPPTRYGAWFWGVAIGAGFGVTEAVTLGGFATTGWLLTVGVRAAAMLMHATMTGLAGIGWYEAFVARRRLRGTALIATAMAGHMAWNLLVLGAVYFGVAAAVTSQAWLTSAAALATMTLIALFAAVLAAFSWISLHAAPPAPAPVDPSWQPEAVESHLVGSVGEAAPLAPPEPAAGEASPPPGATSPPGS